MNDHVAGAASYVPGETNRPLPIYLIQTSKVQSFRDASCFYNISQNPTP
jgi:F420-0:gamma-glutamyl ligase